MDVMANDIFWVRKPKVFLDSLLWAYIETPWNTQCHINLFDSGLHIWRYNSWIIIFFRYINRYIQFKKIKRGTASIACYGLLYDTNLMFITTVLEIRPCSCCSELRISYINKTNYDPGKKLKDEESKMYKRYTYDFFLLLLSAQFRGGFQCGPGCMGPFCVGNVVVYICIHWHMTRAVPLLGSQCPLPIENSESVTAHTCEFLSSFGVCRRRLHFWDVKLKQVFLQHQPAFVYEFYIYWN